MPLRFRKLLRSKDKKAEDLLMQAQAKWFKFQDKKGHALFKSALSHAANKPFFHAVKAAIFFELSLNDPSYLPIAQSAIEEALKGDSSSFDYVHLKAQILDLCWQNSKNPSDYSRAVRAYNAALKEESSIQQRAHVQWDLALLYLAMGKLSSEPMECNRAYELLEAVRGTFHRDLNYLNDLIEAYLSFTKYVSSESVNQKALRSLHYLVEEHPEKKEACILLFAKAYARIFQSNLKKQALASALDFFASIKPPKRDEKAVFLIWAETLFSASELFVDPTYLRHGVEKLKRAHSLDPCCEKIHLRLIEGLAKLTLFEDSKEHISLMTKLIEAKQDFSFEKRNSPTWDYVQGLFHSSLGFYYESKDFFKSAIDFFELALSKDPSKAEWWHAKGCTHMGRSGSEGFEYSDLSKAAYAFDRAFHLKICLPYQMDYGLAIHKLAELKEDLELSEKAYTIFSSAFKDSSIPLKHDWIFHYGSATRLFAQLTGSESLLLQAIDIFSSIPESAGFGMLIQLELGMCYASLGDLLWDIPSFEKAINFYTQVTKIDKEFEPAYFEQAISYIQLGIIAKETPHVAKKDAYWAKAEKRLIHCARLGSKRAFYSLACLYSLTGMVQNALIYFKKAKAYGFLPSLEQIRNDPWLENLRRSSEFNHLIEDL